MRKDIDRAKAAADRQQISLLCAVLIKACYLLHDNAAPSTSATSRALFDGRKLEVVLTSCTSARNKGDDETLSKLCYAVHRSAVLLLDGTVTPSRSGPRKAGLPAACDNLKAALRILTQLDQEQARDRLTNHSTATTSDTQEAFLSKWRKELGRTGYHGGTHVLTLARLHKDCPLGDLNVVMLQVCANGVICKQYPYEATADRKHQCFLFHTRMSPNGDVCHFEPVGRRKDDGTMQFLFPSTAPQETDEEDVALDPNLDHAITACRRRVLEEARAPPSEISKWGPEFYQTANESEEAQRFRCVSTKSDGQCWFDSWSKILPDWTIKLQKEQLRQVSQDPKFVDKVEKELKLAQAAQAAVFGKGDSARVEANAPRPAISDGTGTIAAPPPRPTVSSGIAQVTANATSRDHQEIPAQPTTAQASKPKDKRKDKPTVPGKGRKQAPVDRKDPRSRAETRIDIESKLVVWGIPRKLDTVDAVVRAAKDKGIRLPRLSAVRVVEERRHGRHHHLFICLRASDAKEMLVDPLLQSVRSKLGWRVQAFDHRAGRQSAAEELLRSENDAASIPSEDPRKRCDAAVSDELPSPEEEADSSPTVTPAKSSAASSRDEPSGTKPPLLRLVSLLEKLASNNGLDRLTTAIERLLSSAGGIAAPSCDAGTTRVTPAPSAAKPTPPVLPTRGVCWELRDKGECSRTHCTFRHTLPSTSTGRTVDGQPATTSSDQQKLSVTVDNPPEGRHPPTRRPPAQAGGYLTNEPAHAISGTRPWCRWIISNHICPYYPACHYRHPDTPPPPPAAAARQ